MQRPWILNSKVESLLGAEEVMEGEYGEPQD